MAKKGGSMYYGDLIKGAGDVGASMIPGNMDTWTDIMKQAGDLVIKAAEEQRLQEEKDKAKLKKEHEEFSRKLVMPTQGYAFFEAVKKGVADIRKRAVNFGILDVDDPNYDPNIETETNMNIQQVNGEVKNYQQKLLTHEKVTKEGNVSDNESPRDKKLRNRMHDGEGIELRLLTESNNKDTKNGEGAIHGTVGQRVYIWTIDGVEYNVNDFDKTLLRKQDSEKNYQSLKDALKTEGATKGDGTQYGTGEDGREALRAAIEKRVRKDVLHTHDPSKAQDYLFHWLGDIDFKEDLLDHPDLMNISYVDLKDKDGNPLATPTIDDDGGAWWKHLDDGDKKLIIEAITDYRHPNFNEEVSSEVAIDYMTNQGFAIYELQADALNNSVNAVIKNQYEEDVHGNTISNVEIINEGKKIEGGPKFTFTASNQVNNDGTRKPVTANQKRYIDKSLTDKKQAFQSVFGWLVRQTDGTYNRFSSEKDYIKLMEWREKDPKTRGDKPVPDVGSPHTSILTDKNMTEARIREITIGSEKTAGGGQAKYD